MRQYEVKMVKTCFLDVLLLVQALPEPRPNDAMLPARNSAETK